MGLTLRQYHREKYFRLLEQYRDAKTRIGTPEGNKEFVILSIQLHAAKGNVPKRLWALANK